MEGFAFDRDTRLAPAADGPAGAPAAPASSFGLEVSDRWSGLGGVNGGFMLATCVAAMGAVLPFPDPIVVSGMFLRPGNAGPAVVTAERIRAGRTTAFGQARLAQGGKEVLRATAAFSDLAAVTTEYAGMAPPKLPDPGDCDRAPGLPGITLAARFEYRTAQAPGWLAGQPSGDPSAEFWMRFADGRPADTRTLPLIVDAAAPAVLELGASSTTIELTVHVRARPAPGWLACRVTTRYVSGGYHEEDFEAWDSAGVLVAQSRQLGLVRR
ncbi:MAG TPA: thioesterase family protein [Trebonia sp.]|nr:thioesterase family protein [Trebonia sp.]